MCSSVTAAVLEDGSLPSSLELHRPGQVSTYNQSRILIPEKENRSPEGLRGPEAVLTGDSGRLSETESTGCRPKHRKHQTPLRDGGKLGGLRCGTHSEVAAHMEVTLQLMPGPPSQHGPRQSGHSQATAFWLQWSPRDHGVFLFTFPSNESETRESSERQTCPAEKQTPIVFI